MGRNIVQIKIYADFECLYLGFAETHVGSNSKTECRHIEN